MKVPRVAEAFFWVMLFCGSVAKTASTPLLEPHRTVARKGPVELWLELKETRIKAGSRLRFKLGVKNIGRSPIAMLDVHSRHIEAFEENLRFKRGIYIEAVDSAGNALFANPLPVGLDLCIEAVEPSSKAVSGIEFPDSGTDPYDFARLVWLAPGKALPTPAWELPVHKECEVRNRTSADGYADLWQFAFKPRGKFKVRAVYNRLPPDWILKGWKSRPGPAEVSFTTAWIEVKAE